MLLTEIEKENFASYETVVYDKSFTRRIMEPFWGFVARFIPDDVAPNMISLAALLCLIQAWYLCFTQGEEYPKVTTGMAIFLIFMFWTLDAVDSKHATRIGNDSSLTEFFDHMCSSVGTIFLTLTLCQCYQITSVDCIFHYIQVGQLLILNKHLSGLNKEYISYRLLSGPGEGITIFLFMLTVRGVVGLSVIDDTLQHVLQLMEAAVPSALLDTRPDLFDNPSLKLSRTLFFWTFAWTLIRTFGFGKEHSVTRWSLILCYIYLLIPSGLFIFQFQLTLADAVAHGLVTAMISSDLVVARMAQRELHPWVVIINMGALVSSFFCFVLVPFYYATVLFEVSTYTKLPLLTRVTNVYFDGIFDMPHIGHMNAFKNAAKFGTRLFVGVASDEAATPYKRKPIMTANERYEVVGACKYVYKVIENAPCTKGGLNEEFIQKHRIHVVAHGMEYEKEDDEWYAIPRKMGITRTLPRHAGMSTSELIRRIEARKSDENARKTPALA
mmetsp:Transcript_17469/g.28234  ORF Transcript_17469/g.28234 Transcript_17469/m.28234 type:complete len:498 (-) Transcript_17469:1105-2598(-)